MDPLTPIIIAKALDGLTLRAEATAQNIANANSPGYRPVRVAFEDALQAAARRGAGAVRDVRPAIEPMPFGNVASELRLDLELAGAAQTAMRYAALIDIMGRQMELSRTAIRGGQ